MNKKGMELSINFIVILIFCITVLLFGITLAKNMFEKAIEVKEDIDLKTKRETENALSSGVRVAIPFSTAEMNSGESKSFGLGILNTISNPTTEFLIYAENADSSNPLNVLPNTVQTIEIASNGKHAAGIAVGVPTGTSPGTYAVNVVVCHRVYSATEVTANLDGNCRKAKSASLLAIPDTDRFKRFQSYSTLKKIYITVP